MPFAWTICERNTKYLCITCGKSVCVRVEYSIAEENEDTLGWEANRSIGYCMLCAGLLHLLLQVLGKTNFAVKNVTNSNDIEPAALENESLDEEGSDNVEPACELACESDSGEDDNCDDAEYLHLPLIETTGKSINTLEQETFSSTKPASSFNVATLSSAVFFQTFSLAIKLW